MRTIRSFLATVSLVLASGVGWASHCPAAPASDEEAADQSVDLRPRFVQGRTARYSFWGQRNRNLTMSLGETSKTVSVHRVAEGDIVSVDFGVRLNDWCGDAAETFIVGKTSSEVGRLVDVTRNSLAVAVGMCRPGEKWSNIARAVQGYVESEGFSVVREFVGHGIGSDMHEEPKVPNFVSRELTMQDIVLAEGMVLAIEPMVNLGSAKVMYGPDGWTVVTKDGRPSAHFEHTVAITAEGASVLTNGS